MSNASKVTGRSRPCETPSSPPRGTDKLAMESWVFAEFLRCRKSFAYFANTYCHILSDSKQDDIAGSTAKWVPFRLWAEQRQCADILQHSPLVIILKARQLGLTWLVLALALWLILFYPIATVLLFSRRDDEAVDLLKNRLRGMYDHLPDWLKFRGEFEVENDHEWRLPNGSVVKAFPTTAGDSYTATLAIVDEADLCPDLGRLMRAVKPTIDGGGRMILLSRVDKSKPESVFKKIYRAAKAKLTPWVSIFLPWSARPDRDEKWYADQRADILHRTGGLDDMHEQYPATDTQALAPPTLDRRLPATWLETCYHERQPLTEAEVKDRCAKQGLQLPPAIPGLRIYELPIPDRAAAVRGNPMTPGHEYVIGADTAEGIPGRDDSHATVLDQANGEEVAALWGPIEPAEFGKYLVWLATYYRNAPCLVERNNHGHKVLYAMLLENEDIRRLCGHDNKIGWNTNVKGKPLLWDTAAEVFQQTECIVHSFVTMTQLQMLEGATLAAPEGYKDDAAMSYALAIMAMLKVLREGETIEQESGALEEEVTPASEMTAARRALEHLRMMGGRYED